MSGKPAHQCGAAALSNGAVASSPPESESHPVPGLTRRSAARVASAIRPADHENSQPDPRLQSSSQALSGRSKSMVKSTSKPAPSARRNTRSAGKQPQAADETHAEAKYQAAASAETGSHGLDQDCACKQTRDSARSLPQFQTPTRRGNPRSSKDSLTQDPPPGESEPRRSVRATKGQHTKAFDLENGPEPAKQRRQAKKPNKKTEKDAPPEENGEEEEDESDEELIRCICGAITQEDGDADEPWIACDTCGAWQHNVCVGMSVFTEDLDKDYFCEGCKPENHKATLEAMAKGEKPWEGRRQKYEDDKKKKKGKKGRGKRTSESKDRSSPAASTTAPSTAKSKQSPGPEVKEETPEAPSSSASVAARGKRKSRDHSQGPTPHSKLRKVSESEAAPVYPKYTPPSDLPDSIQKLEASRKQRALALQKSLDAALDLAEKKHIYKVPGGATKKSVTERLAIEIERAFDDTHPAAAPQAAAQLRTLVFNLKSNVDLASQLLKVILPPPSFVIMTGDELATKEQQRENAEMRARAEKQSTLITDDGPRVRRTHKGEEIIESDNYNVTTEEAPSNIRRQNNRESDAGGERNAAPSRPKPTKAGSTGPLRVDTKSTHRSPSQSNFDIGKVFSSVKSPSGAHRRRPSAQAPPGSASAVDDPEVDRLLDDDGSESPPYSPTENFDSDVVWRGPLTMTNVADVSTVAKYVGGADLSKIKGIAWKDLIPPVLTVAGRIPEEKAVPYLCGLRYNNQVDLVITSLSPAQGDETSRSQFSAVIDYFRNKKRYGVVGEKKLGNVRDTYLVPVAEGDGPIPEPMQNIGDHLIPLQRAEPMLLMVFVVRDEKQAPIPFDQQKTESQGTPAAPSDGLHGAQPKPSVPGGSGAPPANQGAAANTTGQPSNQYSQTPVPPPSIPGQAPRPAAAAQEPDTTLRAAHAEGERLAREVLGPLFDSSTVSFLLPHAARMKEGEWSAVKRCLEKDPAARENLPLLSKLLTEEGNNAHANANANSAQPRQAPAQQATAPKPAQAPPAVVQNTIAAAAADLPSGAPQVSKP